MPTESQHRNKCEKNRLFLNTVDIDRDPEWAATVVFYVAVHAVERLRTLANPAHSESHSDRNNFVKGYHRAIFAEYKDLYSISRLARYDSAADFFSEVTPDVVRAELIEKHLQHIERYVESALAESQGK